MFAFERVAGTKSIDGSVDNIYVDLPAGFVGDPTAVPKCSAEQFSRRPLACPPESQVGVMNLEIEAATGGENLGPANHETVYPIYNLEPRKGNTAELGFGYASGEEAVTARIVAKARTNGDFGVTTFIGQVPAALPVRSQQITLWGVPWAAYNDRWRAPALHRPGNGGQASSCSFQPGLRSTAIAFPSPKYYIPPTGFTTAGCATGYEPSWGPVKPFISNLTECTGQDLSTRLSTDAFQNPGAFTSEADPDLSDPDWKSYTAPAPALTGCEKLPFDSDLELAPSSSVADSASGLSVDLNIPQNNQPPLPTPAEDAPQATVDQYVADATAHWKSDAGLATSHLDKAVVALAPGVAVNPASAAGLQGCSPAQIGLRQAGNPPLFNNGDPFDGNASDGAECPQGSIIGTAEVDTPLLEEPLVGDIVLGSPEPGDVGAHGNTGLRVRMYIVLVDQDRGLVAKIFGSAVADRATGQLTATFDKNPRVPFEHMHLEFKDGPRGMLALPQRCAANAWSSVFTPWSAAHGAGGQPVSDSGTITTSQRCGFGFSPGLLAGMDRLQGGAMGGKFSFRFTRADGEQWLRGLTAELPTGLLGAVRDVPLCSNAQANANSCPLASRIGQVDAGAGSGTPFFLERKGSVFLTEGYKGAPYGLAVSVPVEAGPFRGQFALSPIVVRQALHVDRTSAQVTAVSDPLPLIHHGVPLRVRQVTVTVDRPGFMRNPTDCTPKQIVAHFTSAQNARSTKVQPFRAGGCASLDFKPKLALRLTGKRQTTLGKHPGVKAIVTQTPGEAGVEKATVRLPLSLALDPNNAQALCEYADGTKPDLENHCPKGSIVGRARAVSPLLKQPIAGDVYFVKNIRTSSTGNKIATLPMIVVALRGEIAINLYGVSSTTKAGKLVNTFDQVPDAPIQKFNLNIKGGKNGILAVSRGGLCGRKHIAQADFDAQNARRHDRNIRMKTPCKKRKTACRTKKQRRTTTCKRKAAKRNNRRR